MEKTSQFCL